MSFFRSKTPAKLAIDVAMAAGFVFCLAFRLTGGGPHEYIGLGVSLLFVVHCVLNLHWFKTWNKGRYDFKRGLSSFMNVLLILCMAVLCVTGLMNSRHLPGFLQPDGGMGIRQLHSFAAYWAVVFVGLHAGIHWQKVMAALRTATGLKPNALRAHVQRMLAMALAVYGVWAFHDRDMAPKLFQGFAFDFWDPVRPSLLFYTQNLAIVGLMACCAHYGLKLLCICAVMNKGRPETHPSH